MDTLYVTSDLPQAGRTALCCALANILRQRGRTTTLVKPLTTDGMQDKDATFFAQLNYATTASDNWPQSLPQSGEISKEQLTSIEAAICHLTSTVDTVIVEGLPHSIGNRNLADASGRLAAALDAHVLGIVRYTPNLRPETLLPMHDTFGQRLVGVLLNQVTQYKGHDTRMRLVPSLEKAGLHILGTVPEDRRMLAATVDQVVKHLSGRFILGQDKKDTLVEHILIGGLVLESGVSYFERHENKTILVRGDRPDIQMAALNTPTACLILTGGIEPTPYVHYEAQEEGVPLVVVETDTHQTASRLDSLHQEITVHHPSKVDRFQQLLANYVDLEAILEASSH